MEIILNWIFAAIFESLIVFKAKFKNFLLWKEFKRNSSEVLKLKRYAFKRGAWSLWKKKFEEALQKIYKYEKFSYLFFERIKDSINKINFEAHISLFNILLIGRNS